MYNIVKASGEEKQILFQNTAEKMNLHPAIIEKDFWVVMLLDYLFHACPWKHAFTFKGGTSLSKGYQLINRFSEDVDLILDWRVLGYGENEPWEERSKSKQEQFNKETNRVSKADAVMRCWEGGYDSGKVGITICEKYIRFSGTCPQAKT